MQSTNDELLRLFGAPGVLRDRASGRPGLIDVSGSTWWAWVKAGRAPAPLKIHGCTFWRRSDIAAFIAGTWSPHTDSPAVPEPQPVKRLRGRPQKVIPTATQGAAAV
jgi:hypothetical protein